MARRPEPPPVLSRDELAEFTRRLQMLSDDGMERAYRRTMICATRDKCPQVTALQQLVTIWKLPNLNSVHDAF